MKKKSPSVLNLVLTIILSILVVILIVGTIIGLTKKQNETAEIPVSTDKPLTNLSDYSSDKEDLFSLGQIRCVTKSENNKSSILIVNPQLAYSKNDKTFLEELYQKDKLEKNIIIKYFSNYTENELRSKGENIIKTELMELLNQEFVLGKIVNIYFVDFLFIQK